MRDTTRNQRGNVGLLAVFLVVLIGVGGIGYWLWHKHSRETTMTPTVVNDCTHLALSQGSASGAAGTIYKNAVITNNGSAPCTITGYPGVFMLDGSATQVGAGAEASSLYAVQAVTLAPGGKAHTVVAFPQQANFDPGMCSQVGSTMQMYLPGIAAALTAPWSDYSCPGFSASAIKAGAN